MRPLEADVCRRGSLNLSAKLSLKGLCASRVVVSGSCRNNIWNIVYMLVTKVQNRCFINNKKKWRLTIACNVTGFVKIGFHSITILQGNVEALLLNLLVFACFFVESEQGQNWKNITPVQFLWNQGEFWGTCVLHVFFSSAFH